MDRGSRRSRWRTCLSFERAEISNEDIAEVVLDSTTGSSRSNLTYRPESCPPNDAVTRAGAHGRPRQKLVSATRWHLETRGVRTNTAVIAGGIPRALRAGHASENDAFDVADGRAHLFARRVRQLPLEPRGAVARRGQRRRRSGAAPQPYADCALGDYCPEVAFDPLAIRLRALAERVRHLPERSPACDDPARRLANADRRLELITAAELGRRDAVVPASFSLCFPRRWKPSPLQNRHAAAIGRETIAWLQQHGIGGSPAEAEKLAKFDCAMYGGYSMPLADEGRALLVTQFISLWLFWDDMQVEEEQDWDIEAVVGALTSAGPETHSCRYVAAWADLGRRLQRTQSAAWLEQLGDTMRQWLVNAKLETGLAKELKSGRPPSFSTLFECRTISIGMYPTFHLIEFAEGMELPTSFHAHPTTIELKRLASRLVGMGNDLGGLAKDLQNQWLNLVIVLQREGSSSIEDAFQRIVDIHNDDLLEFDRVATMLPSWGASIDAQIARWLEAVRYNVHGFTLWEATAERYQELKALSDDTALIAPIAYTIDVRSARRTG